MAHYEKTIDSKVIYEGKILTLRRDTVELENGNHAAREVVDHPGGVAVLAIDEHEHILFVSQFRYPFGGVMLELPAGKLERGESNATVQTLDRVAKGLGVSLVELVDIREYRTGKLDENAWLDLQRQMGKLSPQQQGDILAFIRMVAKWE